MSCERLDCAQCLTVLALKNDAHGVDQFLTNVDKSNPFDPYVVIPANGIPTLVNERILQRKEDGQLKAYLLTHSTDPL